MIVSAGLWGCGAFQSGFAASRSRRFWYRCFSAFARMQCCTQAPRSRRPAVFPALHAHCCECSAHWCTICSGHAHPNHTHALGAGRLCAARCARAGARGAVSTAPRAAAGAAPRASCLYHQLTATIFDAHRVAGGQSLYDDDVYHEPAAEQPPPRRCFACTPSGDGVSGAFGVAAGGAGCVCCMPRPGEGAPPPALEMTHTALRTQVSLCACHVRACVRLSNSAALFFLMCRRPRSSGRRPARAACACDAARAPACALLSCCRRCRARPFLLFTWVQGFELHGLVVRSGRRMPVMRHAVTPSVRAAGAAAMFSQAQVSASMCGVCQATGLAGNCRHEQTCGCRDEQAAAPAPPAPSITQFTLCERLYAAAWRRRQTVRSPWTRTKSPSAPNTPASIKRAAPLKKGLNPIVPAAWQGSLAAAGSN